MLTVGLVATRGTFSLADVVLLYLIPVVIAAVFGYLWAALAAAVAADLVVNFFFVPPHVLVALTVSIAVDFAARQRSQATRREIEARLLARANTAPVGAGSLPELLNDIKNTFGMTGVALLESRATGEEQVASVGTVGKSRPVLSAPAGDSFRLVAWGPEVFAADAPALRRMAAVAARTLETQRLAADAARADGLAQAEDRERMFEPFQRLHDRSTTGLGLGLAIARGFMEAMGGQILPADTPGGGLTMIISLPTADVLSPDAEPVQNQR